MSDFSLVFQEFSNWFLEFSIFLLDLACDLRIFAYMDKGYYDFNGHRGLPTRYVRIGEEFERYRTALVCVRRPGGLLPTAACKGCWFSKARKVIGGETVLLNCNDIQCSSWDRMDGANVWFVEKDAL